MHLCIFAYCVVAFLCRTSFLQLLMIMSGESLNELGGIVLKMDFTTFWVQIALTILNERGKYKNRCGQFICISRSSHGYNDFRSLRSSKCTRRAWRVILRSGSNFLPFIFIKSDLVDFFQFSAPLWKSNLFFCYVHIWKAYKSQYVNEANSKKTDLFENWRSLTDCIALVS